MAMGVQGQKTVRFTGGYTGAALEENVVYAGAVKFHFPIALRKASQCLLERHKSDTKRSERLSCMVIQSTLAVSGYISQKLFCSKVALPSTGQSPGCWGRLLKWISLSLHCSQTITSFLVFQKCCYSKAGCLLHVIAVPMCSSLLPERAGRSALETQGSVPKRLQASSVDKEQYLIWSQAEVCTQNHRSILVGKDL